MVDAGLDLAEAALELELTEHHLLDGTEGAGLEVDGHVHRVGQRVTGSFAATGGHRRPRGRGAGGEVLERRDHLVGEQVAHHQLAADEVVRRAGDLGAAKASSASRAVAWATSRPASATTMCAIGTRGGSLGRLGQDGAPLARASITRTHSK